MILVDNTLCTGCKRCEMVCPNAAIRVNPVSKKAEINNNLCSECGMCIEECPKNALSFSPQQSKNVYDDFTEPSAKGNIYNWNTSYPSQTPIFSKGNRCGMGFGMGRNQRKGHRRGWFRKSGRRNNRY